MVLISPLPQKPKPQVPRKSYAKLPNVLEVPNLIKVQLDSFQRFQEEGLKQLEARIGLEYDTAYNDARVAAERISTVRKSIQQGEENLRINKNRYQEQVGTATDVIDAQTLLTQTRTEYFRAIFDYQVAVARVKKAMGEL